MNAGEKLKELRLKKGYTLEQLGDIVGVGKSTIRKWEQGMIANIKTDKVQKLADALDIDPVYIVELYGGTIIERFTEPDLTRQEARLLAYYRGLSAASQKKVNERIDELKKLEGIK